MTVQPIRLFGDPVLRTKADAVVDFDKELRTLVHDLTETLLNEGGAGLAAPQIGESVRVLVAEYTDESRNEHHKVALVNPEIVKASDEEELGTEGCLSIPGVVGDNVPRALAVTVKARDPKGKEVRVKAEGWWARILQHEIDHLNGVLYIDLIDPKDVREVTDDEIVDEGEVLERELSGKGGKVEKHGRNDAKDDKKGATVGGDAGKAAGGSR